MTKRFHWLNVLFAATLLLTSVAPAMAQEEPVDDPAEGEQVERVYVPLVQNLQEYYRCRNNFYLYPQACSLCSLHLAFC